MTTERLYRALTLLTVASSGKLVQPGTVVDLGELDVIALRKLEQRRAIEPMPSVVQPTPVVRPKKKRGGV